MPTIVEYSGFSGQSADPQKKPGTILLDARSVHFKPY